MILPAATSVSILHFVTIANAIHQNITDILKINNHFLQKSIVLIRTICYNDSTQHSVEANKRDLRK